VWAATANRGLAPSSCAGRRASVAERVLHGERASTGPSRATEEEIVSPNVPDPRLRWRRASTVRVCLALLFFGCAAKQEASYEVLVRVESEPGRPLAGAQIAFAGQVVGASDAQGRVALRLKGSPGTSSA